MLLGVPFLISQTNQVGSIRAYAQAGEARRGLATAEAIGLALAVYQFYDPGNADGTYEVGGIRQFSVLPGFLPTSILPGLSGPPAQADIPDDGIVKMGGATVANVTDLSLAQRSRQKIFIEALRTYERSGDTAEQAADAAKLSLTISDESGKLDPNFMSVAAWDALLKKVGIVDWDDDDVADSEDSNNHGGSDTRDTTSSATLNDATNSNDDDGPHWPPLSGTFFNDDNDDSDRYGELSRALAELRGKLKGNRITDLDQLLLADPGHNLGTGTWKLPNGSSVAVEKAEISDASEALSLAWRWRQAIAGDDVSAVQSATQQEQLLEKYQKLTALPKGWPGIAVLGSCTDAGWDGLKLESGGFAYGTNHDVVDPAIHSFGFRPRLTRAELERLKPYLTLHNTGQGRDGGISDFGTVVAVGNSNAGHRQSFIDADLREVAGIGTWLRNERREPKLDQRNNPVLDSDGNPILDDRIQAQFAALDGLSGRWNQGMEDAGSKPFGLSGDALALQIPPTVNLNAASEIIFDVLAHAWPRTVSSYSYGTGQSIDIIIPPVVLDLDFAPTSTTATMLQGIVPPNATSLFGRFRGSDGWELLNPLFGWFDDRGWDSSKVFTRSRIEMPAAGFTSTGVVRIEASSVVSDRADHPVAQSSSVTIAQALPQEHVLEKRWLTQADLHALVVQRHASFCTTGPAAAERVLPAIRDATSLIDEASTARPNTDPTLPTVEDRGWMQPRPWPNHATGFSQRLIAGMGGRIPSHLPITWRSDFGSGVPEFLSVIWDGLHVLSPDSGAYSSGELRWQDIRDHFGPDGLDLGTAWNTSGAATILGLHVRAQNIPTGSLLSSSGVLPARSGFDQELAPFHLSFWMKPKDVNSGHGWNAASEPLPIFEMRIPDSAAGLREDGIPGEPLSQNYLGLWYDPTPKLLVLVVAPPSVEMATNRYKLNSPLYIGGQETLVDDRTNATTGPDSDWKQPENPLTTLGKPNRILYCYKMAESVPDRWHHLHVVVSGTRPGEMALIVDGQVGRDVARTGGTLTNTGDHVHLPQVLLDGKSTYPGAGLTAEVAQNLADGIGGSISEFDLLVTSVAGLSAADQFPKRGMLLVGDEYISYEDLTVNTFKKCRRGRRQATNMLDSINVGSHWPVLPQHLAGARVIPAGVRFQPGDNSQRLWRGGVEDGTGLLQPIRLASSLGRGDDTNGAEGRTWSKIPYPNGTSIVANTDIPITAGPAADFPAEGGLVRYGDEFRIYGRRDGLILKDVNPVTQTNWTIADKITNPFPLNAAPIVVSNSTDLVLVGVPLRGDAMQNQVMNLGPAIAQLTDGNGNIEWLNYGAIIKAPSGTCWMFSSGGFTQRGLARTQRRGFSADATVVPVQNLTGAHRLATGDAVTVVHRTPSSTNRTFQAWIRYRPEDQPDVPGGGAGVNVDEANFAFSGPIPYAIPDSTNVEFLVGPSWNGKDLSPMNRVGSPTAALPRFDLADQSGSFNKEKALLSFAAGSKPTTAAIIAGPLTLDGPCAGPWQDTSKTAQIMSVSTIDSTDPLHPSWSATSASLSDLPIANSPANAAILVTADRDLFVSSMGLVLIDGEVFAWRKPIIGVLDRASNRQEPSPTNPNRSAILFGRNLLTDQPFSGGHPHLEGLGTLTALVLPIGPVAMVGWDRRDTASPWLQLTDTSGIRPVLDHGSGTTAYLNIATPITDFDAPAALVCAPIPDASNQTERSVISLIGPRSWSEDPPSWQPSTDYFVGDLVNAGVRIYRCVQTGRSGSNAPILESSGIADGTLFWDFIPGQATISEFTTGTWLTGLYGTPPPKWRNNSNAAEGLRPGDLVIGWWPRYASPLPNAGDIPTAAHLRSRMRSWAGFPFRLRGAVFDPDMIVGRSGANAVATVEVLDSSPDDIEVVARAMAFGADWTVAPAQTLVAGTMPNLLGLQHSPTDVFGFPAPPSPGIAQFRDSNDQPVSTNGAELRLAWQLPSSWTTSGKLSDIARAGGSAPRIGAVRLRCLAPTTVLASERR
ncbi:hypothetical protein LBMAG53_03280 [Planctomycetota bacterium]|nr:hypothetical protein LBMAG53_03280 [Planctomycetota bacterium]